MTGTNRTRPNRATRRALAAVALGAAGVLATAGVALALDWNPANGGAVSDGMCTNVQVNPNVADGSQVWLFTLTKAAPTSQTLTANFTQAGALTNTQSTPDGTGSLHFKVTTPQGDSLLSASTDGGGNGLKVTRCDVHSTTTTSESTTTTTSGSTTTTSGSTTTTSGGTSTTTNGSTSTTQGSGTTEPPATVSGAGQGTGGTGATTQGAGGTGGTTQVAGTAAQAARPATATVATPRFTG